MVRHSALRKVISPDLFAAITGADLRFARRGLLGLPLLPLFFQQPGFENFHGLLAVLELRSLVLAGHYFSGWYMGDADGRIGRVHALAAGPRRGIRICAQVLLFQ